MAVRILIFEDNDSLRESLMGLIRLNESFELVGAYPDVLRAVDQFRIATPDVILMDIDMPGMTGIQAVQQIRTVDATVKILMLTVFDDNQHVFDAIKAGASGYLLKKHITQRLFSCIDELMEGGAPMSPSIARMVISSMQSQSPTHYGLTGREKEILGLLSKGESYKLIAGQLGISLDTVRTHIKKIYEKLQVHSQTEAVSKALNERLV
jgi:DNA-binding NarL/FixJ family response regulator